MSKTITIVITVPDGVEVTPRVEATEVLRRPDGTQALPPNPVCPKHGAEKVKPSKYGGVYCTAADDNEERGYCKWQQK